MSHGYVAVQWTRRKLIYDGVLLAGVSAYLLLFMGISHWWAAVTAPTCPLKGHFSSLICSGRMPC